MPPKKGKSKAPVVVPKAKAKTTTNSLSRASVNAAPVAANMLWRAQKPKIRYEGDRCIVSHVERFGSVVSDSEVPPSTIQLFPYDINPGLVSTFPWLAPFAQRFEKYRFKKLDFQFRSKCATSYQGDVSMAVDYDAADPGPVSTILMDNYDDAVNGSPWQTFELKCSQENLKGAERLLYVRNGDPLDAGLDIKTYDIGALYVGVEGIRNASGDMDQLSVLGYLYVVYEVELVTQQIESLGNPFWFRGNAEGTTLANLLGGGSSLEVLNIGSGVTVGIPDDPTEHIEIAFAQPGRYLMSAFVVTTSTAGGGSLTFNFVQNSGPECTVSSIQSYNELVPGPPQESQWIGNWIISVPPAPAPISEADIASVFELYTTQVVPSINSVDVVSLFVSGGAYDGRPPDVASLDKTYVSKITPVGRRLRTYSSPIRRRSVSSALRCGSSLTSLPKKVLDGTELLEFLKNDKDEVWSLTSADAMLKCARTEADLNFVVTACCDREKVRLNSMAAYCAARARRDYLTDELHATSVPARAAGPKAGSIVSNGD